ncbi:hypothetical protein M514_05802 [Trichuris suis]|uniref:Uncharacterized protein n=1 Tax=Trichuris suis TaxID=68888 RepID=A0A085NN61_9BILA|nr:hypothetical protein M514_05802 [Trichuris suis]
MPECHFAGDGWYNEELDLRWSVIACTVQRGDVLQNSVELGFTGSQPPPPHQLAEVQRQGGSVRAAPLPMRAFRLGPHRLYGLRVSPTRWIYKM